MYTLQALRSEVLPTDDEEFALVLHSSVFAQEIELRIIPEEPDIVDTVDGLTQRMVDIANDLSQLEPSILPRIRELAWACFNRYGELCSWTLTADDEQLEAGEITKNEHRAINRRRQRELFEIQNSDDCWNSLGEPQYRTCLFPRIWEHRFGLITFYPDWDEEGFNIVVRNGTVIGFASGCDPISPEMDDPKTSSIPDTWA